VINDISGNVVSLFRVLQRHYPYFLDFLKFRLSARAEFDHLQKENPGTLTDLERAARFFYIRLLAYSGRPVNANFAVDGRGRARFNILRPEAMPAVIHKRLAGVVIEQLPCADFIGRYDRPAMLFYVEPPYLGNAQSYGKGVFVRADFARPADQQAGINGQFVCRLTTRRKFASCLAGLI